MINKNEAIKNNIKVVDNSIKNELFENLKTNFPQTVIEGKADLKAISLLLGLDKKSDISGYELTWTGKGLSNALYSSPCNKELKLEEIFSNADCKNLNSSNIEMKDSNNPKNIIIRGDNLDVLKILKSAYSEKIKMIYIDPPYNTTNENFIYPDNFRQDYKKILEEVGLIEIDENGEEVESEDLKFFKNIQGSRTHSGWLSFMLPRLKLARDLLKEDGVIFISIDDNEQANLKLLCDEIFGEDNFIENFIWVKNATKNLSKTTSNNHEYILCYAKDKIIVEQSNYFKIKKPGLDEVREIVKKATQEKLSKEETQKMLLDFYKENPHLKGISQYKYVDYNNNSYKVYRISNISAPISTGKAATYEVLHPITKKPCKMPIAGWRFTRQSMDKMIKNNLIEFFDNETKVPQVKIFLDTVEKDIIKSNIEDFTDGKKELGRLFTDSPFDNPKPTTLIKTFLKAIKYNQNNEPDIILDFFAGSGTTAQAVMELNAEDKGNREFILVQIDEEIKEDKSKSAYDFCKKELKSENPVISDITIERVKRAAQKIIQSSKNNDLNLGFKVFTLEDKPEIIIDKDKNLKLINRRNLSVIDKVVNMFLISGKTLDKKIENIFDGKLYKCEDSFYLISFNKEILKYLIKTQNEYIFIDAYGDIELEDFLNLDAGFKERLKVVY